MIIDSIVKIIISLCSMMLVMCLYIWVTRQHDFQLIQLSSMRRDQFLLDKKTGRIWQAVCTKLSKNATKIGECDGMMIWEERYVQDWTNPNSLPALIYEYLTKEEEKKKEQ